jgi:hypothetical protein
MTQIVQKRPIPFYTRKSQFGFDNTISGAEIVLETDEVRVHRLVTDPGFAIEGNMARRRWLIDGVKKPYISYRITATTKGQIRARFWRDETKAELIRDELRGVGYVGGNFNPEPGYRHLDAVVPGSEWFCVYLRDMRVKTGTIPTYIELNQGDQLPVFSTNEPNMYILLNGELNVQGIGSLPDGVPECILGNVGQNRVITKIGPGKAQLLHCFTEPEDYGRLD